MKKKKTINKKAKQYKSWKAASDVCSDENEDMIGCLVFIFPVPEHCNHTGNAIGHFRVYDYTFKCDGYKLLC